MTTIAILGTGIMGTAFAHSLRRNGFDVVVWNRSQEKAEEVGGGTTVAKSAEDAVENADVVLTMLPNADVVESVITPCLSSMQNAVWVQASTVGIEGAQRLATIANDAGVQYLDCPVLGTKKPAEEGKLTVLVGGNKTLLAQVQQVLDALGTTRWIGEEPSSASAMKLVVNSYLLATTAAMAETLSFAEAVGLPVSETVDLLGKTPLSSQYGQMKAEMMLKGEYPPSFPVEMATKGATLVASAASNAKVTLPMNELLGGIYAKANANHADDDIAAVRYAFE